MGRRLITVFVLGTFITLFPAGVGLAQGPIAPTTESSDVSTTDPVEHIIKRGILAFTNENFHEALEIFQKIIDRDQDDPRGYFYKAAVFNVTMQDYRTRAFEKEFNSYISQAIDKAEGRIKVDSQDAEAHFYLGGAYGYRGIDKTLVGSWLGAFLDGTRGVFHLQKALTFNPKYYDAYYGLGSYHYWVSAKSSLLWFLPFFADERARGIEELRLASDKGAFALYEARASLVTVLMNEGRWEEAQREVDVLLEKFSDDLSSHIQRGQIQAELGRWREAEKEFQWIKTFLKARSFSGYPRSLEAEYFLALAAHRQGLSTDFFKGCLRVKSLMSQNRNHAYIEGLSELESRAQELCGSLSP
jgi:tetratricopeptide (TPR) repeat protein